MFCILGALQMFHDNELMMMTDENV